MTPEQMQAWSLQRELDERNRPLTDEEIDAVLPEGYKVIYEFFFKGPVSFGRLILHKVLTEVLGFTENLYNCHVFIAFESSVIILYAMAFCVVASHLSFIFCFFFLLDPSATCGICSNTHSSS